MVGGLTDLAYMGGHVTTTVVLTVVGVRAAMPKLMKGGGGAPRAGAGGAWPTIGETAGGMEAQATGLSCGAACGSVMSGGRVSQQALLDAAGEGVGASSLARNMSELTGSGWSGGYVGPGAFDALMLRGRWTAQMFGGKGMDHYVVVDGVEASGNVRILDPWDGGSTYQMTRAGFDHWWTGIAVFPN